MAAPTPSSLLAFLQQKEFLTSDQLDELAERSQPGDAAALLRDLVRRQWLTAYQANQIAQGSANELILGAYRILDPIGEGGMGKVYKARHVRMHRDVALKVIPPDCLENTNAVNRFYREVRAVSQLSHPNIVAAYEVGQEGKTHYFAMEFVEGIDLARLVKQSGPLPIAKACDYIRQAALGLQHAHEKGLVHRDIKPGNLIIGRSNAGGEPTVKVLDFGLARFEQAGGRGTRLTKLGNVLGTVDYISPEQAGNAREADIRSDIYSLGCALFYLLTGQPPFAGSDAMERMMARVMRPAASVRETRPEVPVELDAIVAKMMAREPGERYATPAEVAATLAAFTSMTTAVTARPGILAPATTASSTATTIGTNNPWVSHDGKSGVLSLADKFGSRKKIAVIAAVVAVVFALAGIGLMNRGGGKKPKLPIDDQEIETPIVVAQNHEQTPKAKPTDHSPLPAPKLPDVKNPPTFTNSLGMEFVLVPKGKSWLGGGGGRPGTQEVTIPDDFYLGKYEVTQDEWQTVLGKNPSHFSRTGGGKDAVKDIADVDLRRFPVEMVSWLDAQEFIKRLNNANKEIGWAYRLPTTVQWEYAGRGGPMKDQADSAFNFYFESPTNHLVVDLANFENDKSLKRTRKVGSYQPNRLGLHDMHGNVWEWCEDEAAAYAEDPKGTSRRWLRGGGWRDQTDYCRAAGQAPWPPANREDSFGLRLTRAPTNQKTEQNGVKTAGSSTRASTHLIVASIGSSKVSRFNAHTGKVVDALIAPYPVGLAGHAGYLYVSSHNEQSILKFDAKNWTFLATHVSPKEGGLDHVHGMTCGPDGNLYVASRASKSIKSFDGKTGKYLGDFMRDVENPHGLTAGPDGRIYVCCHGSHRVLALDVEKKTPRQVFVSKQSGGLFNPSALAFGPDKNLYVCCHLHRKVLRFDGLSGAFIDEFVKEGAGGLDRPCGIAFGPDENLYVSGEVSNSVLRYNGKTGAFMDVFVPANKDHLNNPVYIMFLTTH